MLKLTIRTEEGFDSENSRFVPLETFELELEHSLFSVSKWEAFFEKPFLNDEEKTTEETLWYVRAMTLTPNVPPETFTKLSDDNIRDVNAYITSKQTATWFKNKKVAGVMARTITNEVVYGWMIALHIPFECQYWHFNRLLTLIQVCNESNTPPQKKNPRDLANERRELNRKRREASGSKG